MKRILFAVAVAAMLSTSCTKSDSPKSEEVTKGTNQLKTIKTEKELTPFLKSIKRAEKRTVTLVGKLDLTSISKRESIARGTYTPALTIDGTSLPFGHSVDKEKYHNQIVLMKADIEHCPIDIADARGGHWIVNVHHIEIKE